VPILTDYLLNATLLLAVALLFDLRTRQTAPEAKQAHEVMLGMLVGAVAVVIMLTPVRVGSSIVLDTRGVLLVMSGLYFGTRATLIAMTIAALFRFFVIGGPSAPVGVTFVLLTGGLGLLWRSVRAEVRQDIPWAEFAVVGLLVGLLQLGLTKYLLGADPDAITLALAPVLLSVSAGATTTLGLLLRTRLRHAASERTLAEREASYRTLIEQVPAVIYRAALDDASSTLYLSPSVRALGVSAEDWLADPDLWARMLHPDDRDRVLRQLGLDREAGAASDLTYRLRAGDGSWRLIRDAAQIVRDAEGRPLFLQGLMFDITAQAAAAEEATLHATALDVAADAIAILDRDGNIQWANRAFSELTLYPPAEALGKNPRELLRTGVQEEPFYAHMWNTLLKGQVWKGELVNRRKDGSHYTEEQTITPVKNGKGDVTHFIAIKRDITARRALEIQYQQAQKMEGIGRLAGGVAHDFNNLLTVINGTVELALPAVVGQSELRDDLLEIRRAADRAAALTRQLLAFSRQQVLRVEVLDLNRVIGDMLKMLTRVIGEDVRFVTDLAADLGHVRGDAGQLEQVLLNLTVNSRDAMPNGGTLTIQTRNLQIDEEMAARHVTVTPGPHVMLTVSDTGIGMDAKTRERIFEPFFTTKAAGKGTGLGLPTAYGIIKQIGGSIWVYSEPGRGTTFKIYLPRVDAPIAERASGPSKLLEVGGKETILVVEDEDAIRHVATRVLSRQGYTVLDAASGPEAVQKASAHPSRIHLLMTDMVMPGMTGPELAQQLLKTQQGLKVLFTSGYSKDAVAQQFGMTDGHFISKPYGLAELAREVRRVLDE
jgi:two-component system cell cycle sensor histidine kinase/response regulator CckA